MICKLCGKDYAGTICPRCGLASSESPYVRPLNFGKHKGLTVEQVYDISPSYLTWMIGHDAGTPAQRAKAKLLLNQNNKSAGSRSLRSGFAEGDWWQLGYFDNPQTVNPPVIEPSPVPPANQTNYQQSPQVSYWPHSQNTNWQIPKKELVKHIPDSTTNQKVAGIGCVLLLCAIIIIPILFTSRPVTPAQPPIAPTATLAPAAPQKIDIIDTTGFAIVPGSTSVWDAPTEPHQVIEKTRNSGVVAWQRKTKDGQWYERAGGGWIATNDIQQCLTEESCLAILNPPTPIVNTSVWLPTATPDSNYWSPFTPPQPTPALAPTLTFTSVQGGAPGGYASVSVQTIPNASCDISYFTPAGTDSSAQGLYPKRADGNGQVSWSWKIGTNTRPGTGEVVVTCNGVAEYTSILIG